MDTSRELSRTLFTKQEEVLHLLRLSSEILTSSSRDMNTSLLLKECTQANSSIGELSETMKTTKTSVATNFILTLMLIIVFSFTFNYFKDIYYLKEECVGRGFNCQEIPIKKHDHKKTPKNTLICSPVKNISVSGLRLISKRRRRKQKINYKQKSRSLWSAKFPNQQQCTEGTKMKYEKEYSVSYSGEKIRNLWVGS